MVGSGTKNPGTLPLVSLSLHRRSIEDKKQTHLSAKRTVKRKLAINHIVPIATRICSINEDSLFLRY